MKTDASATQLPCPSASASAPVVVEVELRSLRSPKTAGSNMALTRASIRSPSLWLPRTTRRASSRAGAGSSKVTTTSAGEMPGRAARAARRSAGL